MSIVITFIVLIGCAYLYLKMKNVLQFFIKVNFYFQKLTFILDRNRNYSYSRNENDSYLAPAGPVDISPQINVDICVQLSYNISTFTGDTK